MGRAIFLKKVGEGLPGPPTHPAEGRRDVPDARKAWRCCPSGLLCLWRQGTGSGGPVAVARLRAPDAYALHDEAEGGPLELTKALAPMPSHGTSKVPAEPAVIEDEAVRVPVQYLAAAAPLPEPDEHVARHGVKGKRRSSSLNRNRLLLLQPSHKVLPAYSQGSEIILDNKLRDGILVRLNDYGTRHPLFHPCFMTALCPHLRQPILPQKIPEFGKGDIIQPSHANAGILAGVTIRS